MASSRKTISDSEKAHLYQNWLSAGNNLFFKTTRAGF